MRQEHLGGPARSGRVPFRVPLNPNQLVEICRRRNQRRDSRTLADWVESGLALALAEPTDRDTDASLTASPEREIELFSMIAEVAPSALRGTWRKLYENVWDRHEFWVFPSANRWHDDEPEAMSPEPYLDREALAQSWLELRALADEGRGTCLSGT